jgi:asparagine synthase (glutamine-hydrolysing)
MCGIAGIVGGPPPDTGLLERMADRMIHRGPDDEGVWNDATAGLAFRRLAIIDLDERSNQPLHLGSLHLVFNGEIYNYRELRAELRAAGHRFVTEGDAEVLLHAWAEWREEALDRLNGMFAFAVWDDETRELVCARDPFGEKPFVWAESGGRLAFASDVRALLEARPDLGAPAPQAYAPYLGRGLMPPIDESFFTDIRRLPGAHLLRFREGRVRVSRYWTPRRVDTPPRYEDATQLLRELLMDSIALRLRSDVPVGTSLSGGVDSSAVASLSGLIAGDHLRHAFTARFPGFERDEWHFATAVAEAAGVVDHHAVQPTADELLEDLDALVSDQEEPFGTTSIYAQWRVMRAARGAGVTVLLDGQGADELFGGYPGSNGWALRSEGGRVVLRGLSSRADRRDILLAFGSERLPRTVRTWHRRRSATPYATAAVRHESAEVQPPAPPSSLPNGPLARELGRQSFHTSLPELLRYADCNSMAHSREVRLPFLDRRVAEYAFSLPPSFLYRNGVTKAVLRDSVRDLMPPAVHARRDKVGFETPQARWLSEPRWLARIAEVLLDSRARGRDLYATDQIEADARRGQWRDADGIWRALNLELWLQAFERRAHAAPARG